MRFLHFLLIGMMMVAAPFATAQAEMAQGELAAQESLRYEGLLLEKLNWARTHPMEAATLVGQDPNKLLTDSPSWRAVVTDGLPILRLNSILLRTARQHTQDMLANRYYSYASPSGQTAEERIKEAGYDATGGGEMLGMITFSNFMPPEIAAQNLFEQLLKQDLRRLNSGNSLVFNPSVQDVGIALMAGVTLVGNTVSNAYLLTCDFGSPLVARFSNLDVEFLFLDLINQARLSPVQTLFDYGIDLALLNNVAPDVMASLTGSSPPLVYSPSLRAIAYSRNEQALVEAQLQDSSFKLSHYDHCTDTADGCAALTGETVMGYKSNEPLPQAEMIQRMFKELLLRELTAADVSALLIFNPTIKEFALVFGHCRVTSGDATDSFYTLATAYGLAYRTLPERQSLNLLNQARWNYRQPSGEINSETPPAASNPAPPLIADHQVYAAADAHAREMITLGYFDTYSDDGAKDVTARLADAGYSALGVEETLELFTAAVPFNADKMARYLFDNVLADRMDADEAPMGLFNSEMTAAGIRFLYTTPDAADLITEEPTNMFQEIHSLLLVADVAAPSEPSVATLVCLVFRDLNRDGHYTRGEEIGAVPVTLRNQESAYRFYTDAAGNATVPLPAGTYEVEATYGKAVMNRTVEIGSENNILLPFAFER
ncbi:MAG: hypothetical protein RBT11_05570 [Desulfobacterales bacterium]|jgi:hypothetical protein|nr:hypothetical protein [Desulfobacterales bacterium]